MSEIMRPMPIAQILTWMREEYLTQGKIFGIRKEKFYRNESGTSASIFGQTISSVIGPAAGPNSQLAQNIIAAYLGGSRFIELKTVQKMDGDELRACVARPCIRAQDECYNVEWSTELFVQQAYDEYLKAYFAILVLAKELELANERDFAFNMSVGYDLEGIKLPKIDNYIEGMKDASNTPIWKECVAAVQAMLPSFKRFSQADLDAISPQISNSVTISTLHGCPPDEIERIAMHLLTVKGMHTFVKCNPTLLGYETARRLLNGLGYNYVSFDDHHFKEDLQYGDAVTMFKRLQQVAADKGLQFGVKITNTFPVEIKNGELPGEEMYMSGRALYPLSLTAASRLTKDFDGSLQISYSGGADAHNIDELFALGVMPITMATTILKPGGYERMHQIAKILEPKLAGAFAGVDVAGLTARAENVTSDSYHKKSARAVESRKTDSKLGQYDCFKAPCKSGGCPIEQQIPEYLRLVADANFDEAFKVIAIDNALPSVLGTICNHACQTKCTRLDYDASLQIRSMKKIAADNAQDAFIAASKPAATKTDKKALVIGAGPGGIATALFLRRNGMDVTVRECRDKALGIVSHVIPAFRIAEESLQRDVRMAEAAGVTFQYGCDPAYDLKALRKEFDAVVVATGAWKEGASPVQEGGAKLRDSLAFLIESKQKDCKVELGKRVAVIGGGDVAMDCARAAKKAPGVEQVTVVYRRTRAQMPAEPEELADAIADGVDLVELCAPVSFDGKELRCERMQLGEKDATGRRSVEGTGISATMFFDTVIAAVGARVDTEPFVANGLEVDKRGRLAFNEACETAIDGVYVVGDCKRGPSTIVSAVADAKRAATDILKKAGLDADFVRIDLPQDRKAVEAKKGVLIPASKEACEGERCLVCDQVCEICTDVCPNRANVAIDVQGGGFEQKRQILHIDGMCNECGNCGVFCPHTGNPYLDKTTLFWSEEDFQDSENKGFVALGGDAFKIRDENGAIVEHQRGDGKISPAMDAMIEAVTQNYAYYLPACK